MAAIRPMGWAPERIHVFVVGLLSWADPEQWPSFPTKNRRDAALVDHFRAQGVPAAQLTYLRDEAATTDQVQRALAEHLAVARADDLLVLYFCGHGSQTDGGATFFATYDADGDKNTGWLVDTIVPTVNRHFRGSHAVLLADCCYSGRLADTLARQDGPIAYACFSSSLASELSTGNWTFTEQVLAALRGQAYVDADGNHDITWQELADQIEASMAFAEEQLATVRFHGGFDPLRPLASARPRPDPRVGQRLEVRSEGEWYPAQIIDVDGARLKVHYYGYEESDDEWVTAAATRSVVRPMYAVGTPVEVQWKKTWYPAQVLDIRLGVHHIHYDDFGPEWDEWVAHQRIRPRRMG
jgi:hypothetical protein